MISHRRAVSTAIRLMKVVMSKRSKKDQRRVYKKNYVWCAVIGHPAIITMRSPAKVVRVSFGAALRRMLCTVVNSGAPVKWTCICDENVKSVV